MSKETITVKQAQAKRSELESKIRQMLCQYFDDTGLIVNAISVSSENYRTIGHTNSQVERAYFDVKVDINL